MSGMKKENMMSKEEMLKKIRECARKLGRIPTQNDLTEIGVTIGRIGKRCGTLGQAIREAGLEPDGNGYEIDTTKLLRDWAQVARKLGRVRCRPTIWCAGATALLHSERASAAGEMFRRTS